MTKSVTIGSLSLALLLTGCAQGPGHTRAAGTLGGALAGAAIGGSGGCRNGALAGAVVGMVAGTIAGEAIAEDQERARYGPPPPPPPQTIIVYEAPPPPPGCYWTEGPGYSWYWHPYQHRYYYRGCR